MKHSRLRIVQIAIAVALLNCTGCVQLGEIRAFAELAADVGNRFPLLVRGLYESCMNQQRYIVAQKDDFRFDRFGDLFDESNPIMDEGRRQCQQFKAERERLNKASATLVNYMQVMGDLAADDLTAVDNNIEGFGNALGNAQLLTEAESSAVTNLAKFLSEVIIQRYRQRQLKNAVERSNADIQTLTAALRRIALQNYVLQLENEREAMRSYYRKLARESVDFARLQARGAQEALTEARERGKPLDPALGSLLGVSEAPTNPAPLDDLKTKYEAKNAAINHRIAGAKAFASVMNAVAEGHQKLHDNADKLHSKEVLRTALSYARTIKGLVVEFQEAF
jgi:hypothetical protein